MKKMLLDRMVNLLCCGCVVPVIKYIEQCWHRGDTDISLIRYFVTEVKIKKTISFFFTIILFILTFYITGSRSSFSSLFS